ncbi:DinB protein [Candidatus Vecturithrix granuli]|uniref:DinB protein n=1 Tax=Vecturithrix granuli TaxID=1499967 RepID=A0A081C7N6_VECG1|nr:DinB protein [Candidatus Vecturithrix granuli]
MSLLDPIIAELQHEAVTTRKLFERVPDEQFDWQPHQKSMSVRNLTNHIAQIYNWCGYIVNQDELDIATAQFERKMAGTTQELLALFDENVANAVALLKKQDEQHVLKTWTFRNGAQVMFALPRMAVIRTMVLNHGIHHRGQFSVYLRLLNIPLPPMYGPTADEPM